MYSETFYSLYPGLFSRTDGMLFNDELFRDEGVFGRKSVTSSELYSTHQSSSYLDKEWVIYEIFQKNIL